MESAELIVNFFFQKFSKQKLPEAMQRWTKMTKLAEHIKETKARLAETKSEYKRFAKLVKENSEYCYPVECHFD